MSTIPHGDDSAAGVLRHHAARLTPFLQDDSLPDGVVSTIHHAQRIIGIVAELTPCYKVKASELEPKAPEPEDGAVTEAEQRAALKQLWREAKRWRELEKKAGANMKLHAGDMAREYEVRARVLERKIPPRPWGRYALVGLVSYALGVLSVAGATMWWAP